MLVLTYDSRWLVDCFSLVTGTHHLQNQSCRYEAEHQPSMEFRQVCVGSLALRFQDQQHQGQLLVALHAWQKPEVAQGVELDSVP